VFLAALCAAFRVAEILDAEDHEAQFFEFSGDVHETGKHGRTVPVTARVEVQQSFLSSHEVRKSAQVSRVVCELKALERTPTVYSRERVATLALDLRRLLGVGGFSGGHPQ